jgi:phosphoribosylglycinamide formyltransferase-1
LASGLGTNLAHIHSEIVAGALPSVELALVISNNSSSGAIAYARAHGIDAEHVSLVRSENDPERYEEDFLRVLAERGTELIALAGYLKKLPDGVVDAYANRILNVHPALLPSFGGPAMYGRRVHEAVLARGCKVSGATVHLVTKEYDAGPILLQKCCPVHDDDTPETLERRVRKIEFEIYPRGIEMVANRLS